MALDSDTGAAVLTGARLLRRRNLARVIFDRFAACLDSGRLTIVTPSGERIEHAASQAGPEATLIVHRWRALRRIAAAGDVGFAEAFIAGDWSSPDLTSLIVLAAKNSDRLERALCGWVPLRALNRLRHLLNLNTKTRSRRNIAFHYDLGNEFYRLWLDRSMTYSSALYEASDESLEAAQHAKRRRIIDLLELQGGERVLEIGSGWGALAAELARQGTTVTGVTLSSQQLAHAHELMAAEGAGDRVKLRLQDYRDVEGSFDRIVSVEMLEAVGERYWPVYFAALRRRLKQGGTAILQAITIAEQRFDSYRKSADFIQHYIFPGGLLPTKAIVEEQSERAGFSLASVTSFGPSYALTLAEWRRRFLASWPAAEELGFPASFRRLWEYYLCYCEAGFRANVLDVSLFVPKG